MSTNTSVSVTREISVTPEKIWAMVSDLPRMGEWSPENRGGEWVAPATGAAVGATFKGRNQNGKKSWATKVKVNACEAPKKLSFGLMVGGKNWCDWVYDIEPTATGCKVTHSWIDHRSAVSSFLGKLVSGVADRGAHNLKNMEVTMDNLVKAATQAI
jgi:uncharacterized protein YndB with AHSA1/START domain